MYLSMLVRLHRTRLSVSRRSGVHDHETARLKCQGLMPQHGWLEPCNKCTVWMEQREWLKGNTVRATHDKCNLSCTVQLCSTKQRTYCQHHEFSMWVLFPSSTCDAGSQLVDVLTSSHMLQTTPHIVGHTSLCLYPVYRATDSLVVKVANSFTKSFSRRSSKNSDWSSFK